MNELILGYQDYRNYNALCAINDDKPFRAGTRRYRHDTLTSGQHRNKLIEQDYKCAYCGARFRFDGKKFAGTTVEHVIPFRFGGSANPHNTLLVHEKCNQEKEHEDVWVKIKEIFGYIDLTMLEPHEEPMSAQAFSSNTPRVKF